jgi:uncharacterized membrane protein
MKETKIFFDTNSLNKGYNNNNNTTSLNKQSDVKIPNNKYKHLLPDVDIMAEYEEMSPGTINKIFDMAKIEQDHRHSIDLINIENHNKAIKMGRIFALALVLIIATATVILASSGYYIVSAIFSVASFATIGTVSIIQSGKRFNNKFIHKNYNHNNKINNYKTKSFNR